MTRLWLRVGPIDDVGHMPLFVCVLDRERQAPIPDTLYCEPVDRISFRDDIQDSGRSPDQMSLSSAPRALRAIAAPIGAP